MNGSAFDRLRRDGLDVVDPQISAQLGWELGRQRNELELIASENFAWPAVIEALGSMATNKYAEGYPGCRYYGGCDVVDAIEQLAIDRATSLFGVDHANVQPHSGAQANMAAYMATLKPGDRILGLRLDHGGHLTHGHKANFSGQLYDVVGYGVNPNTGHIDMDEVHMLAREYRPRMIVTGASAYPRHFDFAAFRVICDDVGALLMVDMAHVAGLVAAGVHPSPAPYADIITSTTHKSMAGPRGGFILCRDHLAKAIDSAVFPGIQGGPLMHVVAAKAVCFGIASSDAFRDYQQRVVANASALAHALLGGGQQLVGDGTDNHLVVLDLRDSEWNGAQAEVRLAQCAITVNRNAVPRDPRPPMIASGVRMGTPAATMRGFTEHDFGTVGSMICQALDPAVDLVTLQRQTHHLLENRPLYSGLRPYGGLA